MRKTSIVAVIALAVAGAPILAMAPACSQKQAAVAAEATYTGALLRCVDKSETLAESKACRSKVDAEYKVDASNAPAAQEGGAK